MDHGLMTGMLVAGVLLSAFPLALGVALWVAYFRRWREHVGEGAENGERAPDRP